MRPVPLRSFLGRRPTARDAVWAVVRSIPPGRVMTYGQIAGSLDGLLSARAVGWALRDAPDDVPWQRVVNAEGGCSTDRLPDLPEGLQRALLEAEGVRFDDRGRIDLGRFRWESPRRGLGRP